MSNVPPVDAPYYDEIRQYAVRLTRNWSTGEDIVQETYLRYYQNAKEIPAPAVRAWLYRTARNLTVDLFRRQTRTAKVEEILKTKVIPQQSDKTPDPYTQVEQQETRDNIITLINLLPSRHREVVRLKFQEQLSYDEIAVVTGETKSMVGWLLHEAIQKLKKDVC